MKRWKRNIRFSHVGRRTGENVLAGKKVQRHEDGTDVFEDYWTDYDSDSSKPASLSAPAITDFDVDDTLSNSADDNKSQTADDNNINLDSKSQNIYAANSKRNNHSELETFFEENQTKQRLRSRKWMSISLAEGIDKKRIAKKRSFQNKAVNTSQRSLNAKKNKDQTVQVETLKRNACFGTDSSRKSNKSVRDACQNTSDALRNKSPRMMMSFSRLEGLKTSTPIRATMRSLNKDLITNSAFYSSNTSPIFGSKTYVADKCKSVNSKKDTVRINKTRSCNMTKHAKSSDHLIESNAHEDVGEITFEIDNSRRPRSPRKSTPKKDGGSMLTVERFIRGKSNISHLKTEVSFANPEKNHEPSEVDNSRNNQTPLKKQDFNAGKSVGRSTSTKKNSQHTSPGKARNVSEASIANLETDDEHLESDDSESQMPRKRLTFSRDENNKSPSTRNKSLRDKSVNISNRKNSTPTKKNSQRTSHGKVRNVSEASIANLETDDEHLESDDSESQMPRKRLTFSRDENNKSPSTRNKSLRDKSVNISNRKNSTPTKKNSQRTSPGKARNVSEASIANLETNNEHLESDDSESQMPRKRLKFSRDENNKSPSTRNKSLRDKSVNISNRKILHQQRRIHNVPHLVKLEMFQKHLLRI
ncbi:hypothetical protein CEXT_718301 [Caerostris extrusa]|uniref:Uncharacterized protein n=1 Tax=Caerostris extrusa TaxID=172846 RepID=A0AAV4XIB8_CAEEX|nr:hypothetical protein CEXT_718301 [Caerostris extrusa]